MPWPRSAPAISTILDPGFKQVRVYASSWLGYSSRLSAPDDDGVWTNFGALMTSIKGPESRYGELEKQSARKTR